MSLKKIAQQLKDHKENIILIYAFNAIGKTRLSVEYKNITKHPETGEHAGVYYNAYSEDLFVWDNDEENDGENINLRVIQSSLNAFHSLLTEDLIKWKLIPYNPSYNFYFNQHDDTSRGIESVSFFKDGEEKTPIKISRGEERIFVWCFFLALFEVEGWADKQNQHFFIDDPVSSLDDHNIFITATLTLNLIEKNFQQRKIIITTHHFGLFSILSDWLGKGETAQKFSKKIIVREEKQENGVKIVREKEQEEKAYKICFLEKNENNYTLIGKTKGILLYHLLLLEMLTEANKKDDGLNTYHFVLLRQVLEIIGSFLGKGRFGYVLEKIGVVNAKMPDILNALSHEKVYYQKLSVMNETERGLFREVFDKLTTNLPFDL